jgi:serine/threonine protein kinase
MNKIIGRQVIGRKYKVLEMIGEGAFGVVLKGEHVFTKDKVAIKMERASEKSFMLKNESKIYLSLNKEGHVSGFPNLRWFGKDDEFHYMVMDLLGASLAKREPSLNESLPLNVVVKIGQQMVSRLQVVHEKGLIHRDIKPDNFLFGLGRNSQVVHLIDFGFCKSYLDENQCHLPMESDRNMVGTPNFASINAHDGLSVSRRDDIESAIYVLYYLFLPLNKWNELFKKNLSNNEIKMVKIDVCKSDDTPSQLVDILKYCSRLKYEDEPNYRRIINMLS